MSLVMAGLKLYIGYLIGSFLIGITILVLFFGYAILRMIFSKSSYK